MASLTYNGSDYQLEKDETVLDGLLRHNETVRHGCRSGICQACLLKSDGSAHENVELFQQGLSEAQIANGFFLSCQTRLPSENQLSCSSIDTQLVSTASVIEKTWLNESIIKLVLRSDMQWRAGQFVTLWRDENVARSYSIANPYNADGQMEFHIRHYEGGAFSHWLAESVEIGAELSVQGPSGNCFYTEQAESRPVLLIAMGTGLAPICGVLQDILASEQCDPIHLIVGAREAKLFYYVAELFNLSEHEERLTITWVLPAGEGAIDQKSGASALLEDLPEQALTLFENNLQLDDVYTLSKAALGNMNAPRIFLCGADSFVSKLRKQLFLAGADFKDIVADSFICFSDAS